MLNFEFPLQTRQVTQKCIVAKVHLSNPDGSEVETRPSESRLFRPTDALDDISAMTQTLQEALMREKGRQISVLFSDLEAGCYLSYCVNMHAL